MKIFVEMRVVEDRKPVTAAPARVEAPTRATPGALHLERVPGTLSPSIGVVLRAADRAVQELLEVFARFTDGALQRFEEALVFPLPTGSPGGIANHVQGSLEAIAVLGLHRPNHRDPAFIEVQERHGLEHFSQPWWYPITVDAHLGWKRAKGGLENCPKHRPPDALDGSRLNGSHCNEGLMPQVACGSAVLCCRSQGLACTLDRAWAWPQVSHDSVLARRMYGRKGPGPSCFGKCKGIGGKGNDVRHPGWMTDT